MKTTEIAQAVINDRATEATRHKARDAFIQGATWDAAVHSLLPLVFYEIKKPIYEGAGPFIEKLWPAAADILDFELELLRVERSAARGV